LHGTCWGKANLSTHNIPMFSDYLDSILEHRKFFAKIEPVNFITIATPHLGLLRYPSIISSLFNTFGPKLLSKTGEQFYCQDQWSNTGRPLIDVMADPSELFLVKECSSY